MCGVRRLMPRSSIWTGTGVFGYLNANGGKDYEGSDPPPFSKGCGPFKAVPQPPDKWLPERFGGESAFKGLINTYEGRRKAEEAAAEAAEAAGGGGSQGGGAQDDPLDLTADDDAGGGAAAAAGDDDDGEWKPGPEDDEHDEAQQDVRLKSIDGGYGEVDEAGESECESDVDGDDMMRMKRLDDQLDFNQGYSYGYGRGRVRRSAGVNQKMRYHTYHRGLYLPNKPYLDTKPGATVRQEKVDELLAGNGFDVEKYNKAFPLASVEGGMLLEGNKRAPSAYMNFCKKERPAIVKKNPKASFGEVGKLLGAAFAKLTAAQQNKYKHGGGSSSSAAVDDDDDDEDDEDVEEESDDDDEMEEGEGEGEDAAEELYLDFLGQAMQGAEDEEEPEEEERDEFYNGDAADAADADGGGKAGKEDKHDDVRDYRRIASAARDSYYYGGFRGGEQLHHYHHVPSDDDDDDDGYGGYGSSDDGYGGYYSD